VPERGKELMLGDLANDTVEDRYRILATVQGRE
jgi:hypothetical protein